ncbi:MAG: hypothetical protein HYX78_07615 [Armatimonadetes bacterium]|nr:hypothetical protein [Armatimonadota bacterium]
MKTGKMSFMVLSAIMVFLIGHGAGLCAAKPNTLFPTDLPGRTCVSFGAAGFSKPACGVIYRLAKPTTCGMPLGGIDTGCIDLETSGLLGYCSLFNTNSPRRGPLNVPILGLSVGGKTWVLCDKQPKQEKGDYQLRNTIYTKGLYPDFVNPLIMDLKLEGVQTAKEIHYFGHYPIADVEFDTDAPVSVGLRAWAPFLPGDVVDSMIPGAVFEVRLRNTSGSPQQGTIAFSFPGPTVKEAGTDQFSRREVKGGFNGVEVTTELASYALGVIGKENLRVGGELGADGAGWAKIALSLPQAQLNQAGSSAAVDFSLGAGKEKVVRFVLSWYAPTWKGGGYNWSTTGLNFSPHIYTHMYARHYPSAAQTAQMLAKNHKSLLKRVIAWQQEVYSETKLPVWLKDSLVNILYMFTECGVWAQAKPPMPAWVRPKDGLFGMNESPRDCPQIECIPASFCGNIALVYLFRDLALSTLRGYKGYSRNDDVPWNFGGGWDFANSNTGVQTTLNGACYTAMVDRYAMCWGDEKFNREFYDSVKNNAIFTVNLRPEYELGDRIISMPTGNRETEGLSAHWFEPRDPGWWGMVPHVGGVHMAQLRIARRMAEKAEDEKFARQCDEWIAAAQKSLETKTWLGSHYLLFWEPESGKRSELVFAYQLDGEWITHFHSLPGVFQRDRVKTVLDTVKRCNLPLGTGGVMDFATPDGGYAKGVGYGEYSCVIPFALMLSMLYMYEGQQDAGMDLAHEVFKNIILDQGYAWDMPVRTKGWVNNGEGVATDYYVCMMLWSLPAAIEGKDLSAPVKPGGLVDRILHAAQRK